MDFWKAIFSLLRRKRVGIAILIVSIAVTALTFLLSPARYTSSAMLVLTTPAAGGTLSQDPSKPTGLTNPLLNFGDGLKTTSAILIQAMNTREIARELGAADGPNELTVTDGGGKPELFGVNGPFVLIEGESRSSDETLRLIQRAQQRIRDELVNRQKALNAPPGTYIVAVDVVAPSVPEIQRGAQIQIAATAFVVTFALGLAAAYAVERTRASRRRQSAVEWPSTEQHTEAERTAGDPATERFTPVPPPQANGGPPRVNGEPSRVDGAALRANGGAPRVNGATPAVDRATPRANGAIPRVDGAAPRANGGAPKVNGVTPAVDRATPRTNGATPAIDRATPRVDRATPRANGGTPRVDGATPGVNGATPRVDKATPRANGATPRANGATPRVDGATPGVNGASTRMHGTGTQDRNPGRA